MGVDSRGRSAAPADSEPWPQALRVANLVVPVDVSEPAFLGLDGEGCERLELFAASVRDREAPTAWACDLVPEAVVYDSRSGEVLPRELV
eukprot:2019396-Pyramimonas_sp.AAC.1